MTPAAECKGCGIQWKTKHEPAKPGETKKLVETATEHVNAGSADLSLAGLAKFTAGLTGNEAGVESKHKSFPKIVYHEKTPTEGFEKAEIIIK